MSTHNHHPLPSPPGQVQGFPAAPQPPLHSAQQPGPHNRTRSISFRSDKSHKSSVSYHETSAEKEAKRLHTKADPTMAINEAEPGVVQTREKSVLAPLRGMQHKDAYGNPIADPDRSNPTRNRWERPLDTIRSFEAAIDGAYNRRSIYRSDSESVVNWNRRNSYYSNNGRSPQDGYYSGRPQPNTPRSELNQFDMMQGSSMSRDSYHEPQQGSYYGGHNGSNGGYAPAPPNPARQRYPRMASEPQFGQHRQPDPHVYPIPSNHRSYETVASASGSGSSADPAGYQTDPTSSDNSSIDRMQPPPKKQLEPINDYGIGFSHTPSYQPQAFTVGSSGFDATSQLSSGYPSDGSYGYGAPSIPQAESKGNILRKAVTQTQDASNSPGRPPAGEKRKSWFGRRFSRQS